MRPFITKKKRARKIVSGLLVFFKTMHAGRIYQQELLHLQVVPTFFETFLIVMLHPPFLEMKSFIIARG